MTVREMLESAMEAETQRRTVSERMAARRAMLGLHGGGGSQIAAGTILDPMRQVDEVLDAEHADGLLLAQLEAELDDAWAVIGGISESGADDGAQICYRRYLWLEGWGVIAEEMGHAEDECRALLEATLEYADGIGIPRLREMGRGKWPFAAPLVNHSRPSWSSATGKSS